MSTQVSRTFTVKPPPEVVVPYLADFGHAEAWDPGTVSCTRNDDGPVQVGANWHNVSKIAGISTELTYTLRELSEDRIVLVGVNKTATSTETIQVLRTDAGGSEVTYTNDLQFNGLAKLAALPGKLIFEKLGNETEDKLTEVLNALA